MSNDAPEAAEVAAPRTIDELAAMFYGPRADGADAAESAAAPAADSAPDVALAALYDADAPAKAAEAVTATFEIPEAVQELRKANIHDPALRYTAAIDEGDLVDGDEPAAPEVKTAVVHEMRRMIADVGLSPVEGRELVTLSGQLMREPPSDETQAQWVAEATKRINETAGDPVQAQRDVDLARALVARDPRLGALLERTRLGNHPRVIQLCIERARSEAAAGRLTLPAKVAP